MSAFSIASILGDQNVKDDERNATEELLNNSVQHLYNVFCKNAAARLNEHQQQQHKNNLIRAFPLPTDGPSPSDFYALHKLNSTSYTSKASSPLS